MKPLHVAAYIEWRGMSAPKGLGRAKPSVKQHLSALRMLFDWLVVGHVLEVNPAHAVRGPKHVVKKGRTAVLTVIDADTLTGLRDRALIAGDDLHLCLHWRGAANECQLLLHARAARLGAVAGEGQQGTRSALSP